MPTLQVFKQPIILVAALLWAASIRSPFVGQVNCQLPDDIQRELNQNLEEQARIQALRQQQQASRQPSGRASASAAAASPVAPASGTKHDPNNYSYQQVSPPIQYSYYQPFGDAAAQPGGDQAAAPQQAGRRQSSAANQGAPPQMDFDLNNLNFELPKPQAQVSAGQPLASQAGQPQHYTPSFTGVGGLPVMKPIAASGAGNGFEPATPVGAAPLAPQARVQQGPPLTEADFKDITGGENYGAPGGNDFGLGDATSSASGGQPQSRTSDTTDAQLREFGLPAEPQQQQPMQQMQPVQPSSNTRRMDMTIPDFGGFNPIGMGGGGGGQQQQRQQQPRMDSGNDFAEFGNLGSGSGGNNNAGGADFSGMGGPSSGGSGGGGAGNEFDFAGQPSSRQSGGVDPAASTMNGGAPGSLQSLLGSSFPGLGGGGSGAGGNANSGLDDFAGANNNPQASNQRQDDNAMDVADLGEKADGFSGADLGGFEQPNPQNDRDFNYGAASNQQPKSVPYPDGNPQPVGTLWALTQPQSLSQTRYNALPDKGTYQDYPAYASGGNDFGAIASVVDETPRARSPGPGRYGLPSAQALAPEVRDSLAGSGKQEYNYAREPASVWQNQRDQSSGSSDRAAGEFEFPFE